MCFTHALDRALEIVQGLYKQHPLVGTLAAEIYFCTLALTKTQKCSGDAGLAVLLEKSYRAFTESFGTPTALLLLPLLGVAQGDTAFMQEVVEAMQHEPEWANGSILAHVAELWPEAAYRQLEAQHVNVEVLRNWHLAKQRAKQQRPPSSVPVPYETRLEPGKRSFYWS